MYVCLSVCIVKSSAAGQRGQGASEPARSSCVAWFLEAWKRKSNKMLLNPKP